MARLLVAEDDADILALIVITLEYEGHEVVTARDGAEAVRAALTGRFEAIVLDGLMPKVDGLTALRELRK
jgi:DNA-binding response OmpR family regulator